MTRAPRFDVWNWIETNQLGDIKLGQPQRDIMEMLGPPEYWIFNDGYLFPPLMRYGSLEFIFDPDGDRPLHTVTYESDRICTYEREFVGFNIKVIPDPPEKSAEYAATNFPERFTDIELIIECERRKIAIERRRWGNIAILYGLADNFYADFMIDEDEPIYFGQLAWCDRARAGAYQVAIPEPLPNH